jgi:hypothetical protein
MAACAVLGLLAFAAGTAIAATLQVCVPEAAGTAVVTPKPSGACKSAYTKTKLLPEAEEQELETILPYVKYVAAGVAGKPRSRYPVRISRSSTAKGSPPAPTAPETSSSGTTRRRGARAAHTTSCSAANKG